MPGVPASLHTVPQPRFLGLDLGTKRIGVAVSDELGLTAQPVLTLGRRRNTREDMRSLARLARRFSVEGIVVGNPLRLSGENSERTEKTQVFAHALGELTGLPIHLWDERLTTREAHQILYEAGHERQRHRQVVDQVAATLILQSFLDSRNQVPRDQGTKRMRSSHIASCPEARNTCRADSGLLESRSECSQSVGGVFPDPCPHPLPGIYNEVSSSSTFRGLSNSTRPQRNTMPDHIKNQLQKQIAELEHELAHELPAEIKKAVAMGDLSENAEYHMAKQRQDFVNARLGQLKRRMAELSLVNLANIPRDKAGFGSTVVVYDSTKDEELVYRLVTSEESDVAKGLISTTSPIGRGLVGKQVGDVATIHTPNGKRDLEILKLTTIHDEAETAGPNGEAAAGSGAVRKN